MSAGPEVGRYGGEFCQLVQRWGNMAGSYVSWFRGGEIHRGVMSAGPEVGRYGREYSQLVQRGGDMWGVAL